MLLPELVTCLIVIVKRTPGLLQQLNVVSAGQLHSLLDALDAFNRCAPGLLRDDTDDLSFPSLQGLLCLRSSYTDSSVLLLQCIFFCWRFGFGNIAVMLNVNAVMAVHATRTVLARGHAKCISIFNLDL